MINYVYKNIEIRFAIKITHLLMKPEDCSVTLLTSDSDNEMALS